MIATSDWDLGTIGTLIFGIAATIGLIAILVWTMTHGD